MATSTTNYGLYKPAVNDPVDEDLWGGYLNDNMDTIDAQMYESEQDIRGAESDIASAATTAIGGVTSGNIRITGTDTITSFGTVAAGIVRRGRFSAAAVLTHNATSLILPGAANITAAAGDTFEAVSLGSGNWYMRSYQRASGSPIANTYYSLGSKQVLTASATWTRPAGCRAVVVRIVGGGGGGGGSGSSDSAGGGGGGGYAEEFITSPGATETVTIGAGGAGGTGDNSGVAGGTTSFGSHCSATGGSGGTKGGSSGAGGAGGTGSGGDINIAGGGGGAGTGNTSGLGSAAGVGGAGGSSVLGGGGAATSGGGTGSAGGNYGGGGAGASSTGNGGAGAGGVAHVYEYY